MTLFGFRSPSLAVLAMLLPACDCGSSKGPSDSSVTDLGSGDAAHDGQAPSDAGMRPPPDLGIGITVRRFDWPNARGEAIDQVYAKPSAGGPFPLVLLLHGSGGLFHMPAPGDTGTCSDRLEPQFEHWAKRLVGMGFAVLMPDSFGSRGFCDFNVDPRVTTAFPPIAVDVDGKTRRIVGRIYDADSALRFAAGEPDVRSDRIGLLGFSNGASVVALYLHHELPTAWATFAASTDGQALGVALPALAAPVPVTTGVAYYPGCGFDGVMSYSTNLANLANFYYPSAPLRVNHAELDPLLDHCSVTQTGTREFQADTYAAQLSLPDRYDIGIYAGASHGFDSVDCELVDAGSDPDVAACRDALPVTLGLLTPLLAP